MPDQLANLDVASYLGLVLVVGVLSQVLAWRLRVPSILLLLVVGFLLGQFVMADQVLGRDVLFGGVSIAVGVILFEGALSLDLRELRELGRPVLRLCSLSMVVAWALIALACRLVGLDTGISVLAGAILVVTGPTVIGPILRTLRPTKRVSLLLRWEGIVVDPIGAALAVLVAQALVSGHLDQPVTGLVGGVVWTAFIAVAIAIPVGFLVEVLMRRHLIPDHLQGVAFLAAAVGSKVASDQVQADSGLLTVTVLGIWLANRPGLHLRHVREFKEHLQVLFVGGLFIVLAGRITPSDLVNVLPQALALVALLVLVVRPLSITIGLWRTSVTKPEKRLLSGMAPRGIVAAAVTSSFALEFEHAASERAHEADVATGSGAAAIAAEADRLAGLAAAANELVPVVFVVIVATVAIYGLGVGRLARRLGLASADSNGVLFSEGSPWVIQAAKRLEEVGVPTLLVSSEYSSLAPARGAGLSTVTANILSDYAVRDLDLAGIGHLIACSPNDEANATAAHEFAHVLGRQNVYQLAPAATANGVQSTRKGAAAHLTVRTAFQPPTTYDQLHDLVEGGAKVKRTTLTPAYTRDDFAARYGERAVVMFVIRDGEVELVGPDTKLPKESGQLIALVSDDGAVEADASGA
ncbi:cation:proton antiporter [Nocardioides sp.]|uniref:cation:proton antiporter n=1 Tax=Nocardioides sp. TaxID=35761 RepID=UPI003562DC12